MKHSLGERQEQSRLLAAAEGWHGHTNSMLSKSIYTGKDKLRSTIAYDLASCYLATMHDDMADAGVIWGELQKRIKQYLNSLGHPDR